MEESTAAESDHSNTTNHWHDIITSTTCRNTNTTSPLHTSTPLRRRPLNHAFAFLYTTALLILFYHHFLNLTTTTTLSLQLLLFVADLTLAFQWFATQLCFRTRPIRRREFPNNLTSIITSSSSANKLLLPSMDIFICTADPYKEPPMGVVNTALSVMAYEYFGQERKLSVYISDDGGSQLTLFAFFEAARFAKHWLPFCRENGVEVRAPEAYFKSSSQSCVGGWSEEIKTMYERMKTRVESVVDKGRVEEEDIIGVDFDINEDVMREAFSKWTTEFTRHDHPPVVQVLLDDKSTDITNSPIPNLIYISRGKSKTHPHHFKAGALNTLLRVSSSITNSPIILTLDCDFFSNDPHTLTRVLCYFLDPILRPELAYVQFPQIFHGINRHDIYACEHKRLFQINQLGFDGYRGPNYVGSNCFFQRRAFFGGPNPSEFINPEISHHHRRHSSDSDSVDEKLLTLVHRVAEADYETIHNSSLWGTKIGFRYGSLVEDFYTGYRLQCEGWRSVFCQPDDRPAFLGDIPFTLLDLLGQCKRWSVGLLEVLFCKYSVLTYGIKNMGLNMAMGYAYYTFWPIMSLPILIYGFLPPLALLNGVSLFPQIFSGWSSMYLFLFTGAYGQDLLDFILAKGTFHQWWNCQRIWMICGLSSFLFGLIEYILTHIIGISVQGFNVTSKVQEDELDKRYKQGRYEFGVESPMFVPMSVAAVLNLVGLVAGVMWVWSGGSESFMKLGLEMVVCGFVVINSWPVYEAMVVRTDQGRLPTKITVLAGLIVATAVCFLSVVI